MFPRLFFLLTGLLCSIPALAQDGLPDIGMGSGLAGLAAGGGAEVKVSLVPETGAVVPGQSFRVGIRLDHSPQWHSYWRNPGGFSLPTEITWNLPEGFKAGPVRWPTPELVDSQGFKAYAYSDSVLLVADIIPPANLAEGLRVKLAAQVKGQTCKESCTLFNQTVSVELPVATTARIDAKAKAAIDEADAGMARPLTAWKAEASEGPDGVTLSLQPVGPDAAEVGEAYFFSYQPDVDGQVAQTVTKDGKGLRLALKRPGDDASAKGPRLAGVVFTKGGWLKGNPKSHSWEIDVPVAGTVGAATLPGEASPRQPAPTDAGMPSLFTADEIAAATALYHPQEPIRLVPFKELARTTLWTALVGAFLGGILLNLMPCVFPVLGLKVLGFAKQAGDDPRKIRLHGLVFAFGVVVSMWILAGTLIGIRFATGTAMNWGAQLGNPVFVACIIAVLFLFGLNMAGLFEIGTSLTSVGGDLQHRGGYAGSFFSGILTTVIATPCSGPFLGAAISYAVNQPPFRALVIFTIFALGIASPYLVFSFFPALLSRLPRPGAWMETFKKLMAFALLGSAAFFLKSFGVQTGLRGMWWLTMALVVLAVAAFCYGNWNLPHRKPAVRHLLGKVLPLLVAALAVWMARDAVAMKAEARVADVHGEVRWEPWKPGLVELARQKKKILWVDYTADWCLTCKFNEQRVLSDPRVLARLKELGVVTIKVDLTTNDPVLAGDLARAQRTNIPVWLFYPADASQPAVLLEEVISPADVLKVLDKVSG